MRPSNSSSVGNTPSENKKLSVRCRFCKSRNHIKKGFRKTKMRGRIQKYLCKDCGRLFVADEGFIGMRFNPKDITKAIDLYFSNLSSRNVRDCYKRHEGIKVSHMSVLDWCRRYTMKVYNFVEKLSPTLSGKCYGDETFIDCEKRKDKFWACVDWDSRFINAIHYSLRGTVGEAITFLRKISKHGLPKFIQTDAAQFYEKAFRRLFYSNKLHGLKVEHRVVNTQKTKKYNVRIETVFSKIKDRVDDFRGLKALWSAPILLAGIVLQHNFIQEHTTTGEIPCELAGLRLDAGVNRWLGLIKLASV